MPQHIRCGIFVLLENLYSIYSKLFYSKLFNRSSSFDYSKLFSLAIYLPRISNSIFTTVPTSMLQKLVFSRV